MAVVLVVDDEPVVPSFVRNAPGGAGHRVVTADDGREGLRAFHANRPDVVITDIFMPVRSGIDLVLELARLQPVPKIIAMSGVAGPGVPRRLPRGGRGADLRQAIRRQRGAPGRDSADRLKGGGLARLVVPSVLRLRGPIFRC
jgi:CheY-like chemotaxis protein